MQIFNVMYVFFVELVTVLITGLEYYHGVEMEIIEESGVTRLCPTTLNYPMKVADAAGSSLPDNTISICGGEYIHAYFECYTLKDSKWENVGNLLMTRIGSASSTIGNGKGTYN